MRTGLTVVRQSSSALSHRNVGLMALLIGTKTVALYILMGYTAIVMQARLVITMDKYNEKLP